MISFLMLLAAAILSMASETANYLFFKLECHRDHIPFRCSEESEYCCFIWGRKESLVI